MAIKHFTDNDLYKFTTMNAIQKLYPDAIVKYKFINRENTPFPTGFGNELKRQVNSMSELFLTKDEEYFIRENCYYFDPVFVDFLKGYRYDPKEIKINQNNTDLNVEIEGYWYRTVLWEVPLLALISELYHKMNGHKPTCLEENAKEKAMAFNNIKAEYSDFGTRRRFSFDVHDRALNQLIDHSGDFLKGSSNLYLSMKYNLTPVGTHPHEWFMYHAAHFGYKTATTKALKAWSKVYQGNLGIALTDTFTTDDFLRCFNTKFAKLFEGVRWDSGDPLEFTDKVLHFYNKKRIDPASKTVVYSDSLNIDKVKRIREYVNGRLHDVYGIGTYLTNDVGVKPLNIVIKMTQAKPSPSQKYYPTIKLSDVSGKNTGSLEEINLCKRTLQIN